ncbi:PPC domain-containing DNA-binding protein [Xylophilus sp. GOD-11R]|uniref:PPC domain-containing DNA-binding protein n=1 Tax=Xylophilus sp. GOD-11R TaxID=3089814 RepID=UPI00298C8DAE|nr:PPC domain-containing DNA-binding protein [Xylophilus sp. GOD-11R]WPB55539.1 DNA-binding protein [Xylophilus sp. GOD-11R]
MRSLPIRLLPGDDLRAALQARAIEAFPDGAFVVCGIGSLGDVLLRLAGADDATRYAGDHEIVSLSGTVTPQGPHLHVSVASASGEVRGGHVVAGNVVRTTAEVLVVEAGGWRLSRETDVATGYLELAFRQDG